MYRVGAHVCQALVYEHSLVSLGRVSGSLLANVRTPPPSGTAGHAGKFPQRDAGPKLSVLAVGLLPRWTSVSGVCLWHSDQLGPTMARRSRYVIRREDHGHSWGSGLQATRTAKPSRKRWRKPTDRQGHVDILGTAKGSAGPVEPGRAWGGHRGVRVLRLEATVPGHGSGAASPVATEQVLPLAGHMCGPELHAF